MDLKLAVVILPISDVCAKAFYVDQARFTADYDMATNESFRIVQLTPPGSATSISIGINLTNTPVAPGSTQGLRLVVDDIDQAKDELSSRGVDVNAVDDRPGVGSPGTATRTATGGSSTKRLAAELECCSLAPCLRAWSGHQLAKSRKWRWRRAESPPTDAESVAIGRGCTSAFPYFTVPALGRARSLVGRTSMRWPSSLNPNLRSRCAWIGVASSRSPRG